MTNSQHAGKPDGKAAPGGSVCPACKTVFECGAQSGVARCWCFDLPPVKPSATSGTCLCPACLAAYALAQSPG